MAVKLQKGGRNGNKTMAYVTPFLYYGIIATKNENGYTKTYSIESRKAPFMPFVFHDSVNKPRFPFWVYNVVAILNSAVQNIPYFLAMIIITAYFILFGFMHQCLFRESFITSWMERVSGYLWLCLGLSGIASIIYYFYN